MKKITQENNFAYLCVALIALLFSAAIVQEFPNTWGEEFFSLVLILMLVVSIKSVKTEMAWKGIVYVLAALLAVLIVISKFFIFPAMPYVMLLLLLFFFMGSFKSSYKKILLEGKVDKNKIIGSLSLYLLLGLIWTMVYLLLLELDPNAFSGIEAGSWRENFSKMAYYSFVTVTTLGYGDILPQNHLAEFFAYMEAVIGVFYMAIIVATLVSLGIAKIDKKDK
jgi:hypothetical protein